ncbi:MAG: hypothetical protein CVU77_06415 [Elusimicrobia bacterium HGW-Elusimicrobia-1]|jgi:hypothetical protein|nr:MAG: hypothetical protein CVU77_06415 [Elusimicrobia bacterium HGW-Elusimicrobia-1]
MKVKDIKKILSRLLTDELRYRSFDYGTFDEYSKKYKPLYEFTISFHGTPKIQENPQQYNPIGCNYEGLNKLYSQVNERQKNVIIKYLEASLNFDVATGYHKLLLAFLIRNHFCDLVLSKILNKKHNNLDVQAINDLVFIVRFEHNKLPDKFLKILAKYINKRNNIADVKLKESLRILGLVIDQIEHFRIIHFLVEDENYEIVKDAEKVLSYFEKYKFKKDFTEALKEIEKRINSLGTKFDFKHSCDLIRSLLENFNVELAEKISIKTKVPPSIGTKNRNQEALNYLVKNGVNFLAQKEIDLCSKLYGLLSDKSGHRLFSDKEYARVAKNYTLEWCYMCLTILDKYL